MELHDSSKQQTLVVKVIYLRHLSEPFWRCGGSSGWGGRLWLNQNCLASVDADVRRQRSDGRFRRREPKDRVEERPWGNRQRSSRSQINPSEDGRREEERRPVELLEWRNTASSCTISLISGAISSESPNGSRPVAGRLIWRVSATWTRSAGRPFPRPSSSKPARTRSLSKSASSSAQAPTPPFGKRKCAPSRSGSPRSMKR